MASRLAIAALIFGAPAWIWLYHPLTVDDAFITFRFAEHLHQGMGFVWNPGQGRIEGMTSLLWTALLAPFAGDKSQMYFWAKVLGLLFGGAALALAVGLERKVWRRPDPRYAFLIVAASPLIIFHALSGMETALGVLMVAAMLFSACAIVGASEAQSSTLRSRVILFGSAWVLGAMTRPELALYGLLVSAFLLAAVRREHRRCCTFALLYSAVIPGGLFFVARASYFGRLLPLPFYAKSGDGAVLVAKGLGYVGITFVGLLGAVAALGALRRLTHAPGDRDLHFWRMLWWPAIIGCCVYAVFDPAMGYVYRFTVPYLIPLVLAAFLPAGASGASRAPGSSRWFVGVLLSIAALQLISAAVPAYHVARVLSTGTISFHAGLGKLLAGLPERGRLLAFNDIGGPAYFSDWEALEGRGLVTPEIAHRSESPGELIARFAPDVLILSGCDNDLLVGAAQALGFELLRKVPWLAFERAGARIHQCVLARSNYAWKEALRSRLPALDSPPMGDPWYFGLYRTLKRTFRQ